MDVKTIFLKSDIEENIYIEQPESFFVPGQEHKVCKLLESLCRLKQASKQQYNKFDLVILSYGFFISEADKSVYTKVNCDSCVIIHLYVDNILIFGTNIGHINDTKSFLSSNFDMKDLGQQI